MIHECKQPGSLLREKVLAIFARQSCYARALVSVGDRFGAQVFLILDRAIRNFLERDWTIAGVERLKA